MGMMKGSPGFPRACGLFPEQGDGIPLAAMLHPPESIRHKGVIRLHLVHHQTGILVPGSLGTEKSASSGQFISKLKTVYLEFLRGALCSVHLIIFGLYW